MSRNRSPLRRRGLLAFGTLVLLLIPVLAIARPGGGEGFSGGSGGSGGGGDSGFIFLLIRLWIEFVFHYPLIGIPMTIAGVLAFMAWKKTRNKTSQ
ncbi:MAG: hypothetical protein ABUL63_03945, partial [Acidobacteriota bacterium]